MDGEDRKTIIASEHVVWPNAVSVDEISERLYWVDGKLGYLGSSNLDGSDMRQIITTNLRTSFGLAVFENTVYWTQTSGRVFKADKKDGSNLQEIRGAFFATFAVQINHPSYKLPGKNNCYNLQNEEETTLHNKRETK